MVRHKYATGDRPAHIAVVYKLQTIYGVYKSCITGHCNAIDAIARMYSL